MDIKIGMRFGKWLVLGEDRKDEKGRHRMLCRCDCGNERMVMVSYLARGKTVSCGCGGYGMNNPDVKVKKVTLIVIKRKVCYNDYLQEIIKRDKDYEDFIPYNHFLNQNNKY